MIKKDAPVASPKNNQQQEQEETKAEMSTQTAPINPIIAPTHQQQQQPQQQPQAPNLSRDEILVTEQFQKYERKLYKEYKKQVRTVEKPKRRTRHESSGHHHLPSMETNMSAEHSFLMTRMPLMDFSFQKRISLYSASEQIRQSMEEYINVGQNIRFLGYDSILQPYLLFKLIGFMIIFGMNAPGKLKWVCIALLVVYYFTFVRNLYIQHFNQQRNMLELNQDRHRLRAAAAQNNNPNPLARAANDIPQGLGNNNLIRNMIRRQGVLNRPFVEDHDNLNQPQHQFGLFNLRQQDRQQANILQTLFVVIYYFVLSLNHDWMQPVLVQFRVQREIRRQELALKKQRKQEKKLKKRQMREQELKQKMDEALKFREKLQSSANKLQKCEQVLKEIEEKEKGKLKELLIQQKQQLEETPNIMSTSELTRIQQEHKEASKLVQDTLNNNDFESVRGLMTEYTNKRVQEMQFEQDTNTFTSAPIPQATESQPEIQTKLESQSEFLENIEGVWVKNQEYQDQQKPEDKQSDSIQQEDCLTNQNEVNSLKQQSESELKSDQKDGQDVVEQI